MSLSKKNLKWGTFETPQSKGLILERYVLENMEDLSKFEKEFPQIKHFKMKSTFERLLSKGDIIILTDVASHGYPTWCTESSRDNEHVSSFYRIKLG